MKKTLGKTIQDRRKQSLRSLWRRHVFVRAMNPKLESLLTDTTFRDGIYFIGCGDEIVYIGQTNSFERRTIESLGRIYHQISDTSLPWSIGLARCHKDANELESTAIRMLAPKFNTSVPAKSKSRGEEPQIEVVVPVFADQEDDIGGAFMLQNLQEQAKRAEQKQNPPWMLGHSTRRSSAEVYAESLQEAVEKYGLGEELIWNDKTKHELMRRNGLSETDPLTYPINLIENGDVITIDGEYLGKWEIDEDRLFNFIADGETSTTLTNVFVGLLCRDINEWLIDQT